MENHVAKRSVYFRRTHVNLRFYQADFTKIKEKERAISQRLLTRSLFICTSRIFMVLVQFPT